LCFNYPPSESRVARQGDTLLRLRVAASGHVVRAAVLTSSGSAALDNAAVTCVSHWIYRPQYRHGRRIATEHMAVVRWRMQH
jgi:periplasmic protein TonB